LRQPPSSARKRREAYAGAEGRGGERGARGGERVVFKFLPGRHRSDHHLESREGKNKTRTLEGPEEAKIFHNRGVLEKTPKMSA